MTFRRLKKFKDWEDRSPIRAIVIGLAMVVIVSFVTVQLIWLLWPYDNLNYGKPGAIATEEYTSEGIPVVRIDGLLRWDQSFCSENTGPTVSRGWLDLYGQASFTQFPGFQQDMKKRTASFEIPSTIFWVNQNVCATTTISLKLPNHIPTPGVYQFRLETSYEANPVRSPVASLTTRSFLLLDADAPIP